LRGEWFAVDDRMWIEAGLGELLAKRERVFCDREASVGDLLAEVVQGDLALEFLLIKFPALVTEGGARREIGEALESEELVGRVFTLEETFAGGREDGVVDFFGHVVDARATEGGVDFVELREGKVLAGGDELIHVIEAGDAGVENLKRLN